MNRDEYRQSSKDYFQDKGWEQWCSLHMNFPQMLKDIAVELFIKGDIISELSIETQRRLKQLKETGITDK